MALMTDSRTATPTQCSASSSRPDQPPDVIAHGLHEVHHLERAAEIEADGVAAVGHQACDAIRCGGSRAVSGNTGRICHGFGRIKYRVTACARRVSASRPCRAPPASPMPPTCGPDFPSGRSKVTRYCARWRSSALRDLGADLGQQRREPRRRGNRFVAAAGLFGGVDADLDGVGHVGGARLVAGPHHDDVHRHRPGWRAAGTGAARRGRESSCPRRSATRR